MLDLVAVRQRLDIALAPTPVAGAADLAAVIDGAIRQTPAVWIVPLTETGGANGLVGALHQQITVPIGVIFAARNVSDSTGDAAITELSALRAKVRASLLNWTPDELPGGEPFRFSRGGLLSFKNAILWWQDQYVTKYILRAV